MGACFFILNYWPREDLVDMIRVLKMKMPVLVTLLTLLSAIASETVGARQESTSTPPMPGCIQAVSPHSYIFFFFIF